MDTENIETEIIEERLDEEEHVQEEQVGEEEHVHGEQVGEEEHVHEEQVGEEEHLQEEQVGEEEHLQEEQVGEEEHVHEEQVGEEEHLQEHVPEEVILETQTIEEHAAEELIMETQTVQEFVIETSVKEEPAKYIPKIVFIIPYRDRKQHQEFFSNHMNKILEDYNKSDYEIYYAHQCDSREFNRGAMKNIGFLTVKEKYPDDYKNITFVFNDVDIMPKIKELIQYDTTVGVVKHFYGYKFTLGGIVSIKGEDFEKVGGFPNFWAWGYEDNLLQMRVLNSGLIVDRTQFYNMLDNNFIHLNEGMDRLINKNEFDKYLGNTNEGFATIQNINKNLDEDTGFINITEFNTGNEPISVENKIYDIRNGNKPYAQQPLFKPSRRRSVMGMHL
jgi:hypothetical protein